MSHLKVFRAECSQCSHDADHGELCQACWIDWWVEGMEQEGFTTKEIEQARLEYPQLLAEMWMDDEPIVLSLPERECFPLAAFK